MSVQWTGLPANPDMWVIQTFSCVLGRETAEIWGEYKMPELLQNEVNDNNNNILEWTHNFGISSNIFKSLTFKHGSEAKTCLPEQVLSNSRETCRRVACDPRTCLCVTEL